MITKISLKRDILKALKEEFYGLRLDADVVDTETGEILIPYRRKITVSLLRRVADRYDHVTEMEIDGGSRPSEIMAVIDRVLKEKGEA